MQRLEYDRYGGPEVVHLSAYSPPEPAPDEVVVRVAASSINPMDWKIRRGDMKMVTGSRFPRAMGTDFAGTVHSVGAHVTQFEPGDAVVGTASMRRSGAFAPVLVTSQDLIVKKPAGLSFAEAASLPIAGVTAWIALVKKARLKPGQRLLVNGAMGAVGLAAGAIARALGADVAGRVGRKSIPQALALGIRPALDYTQPVSISLDGVFDVVLDCNGSLSARDAKRLVKPGGVVLDIVPNGGKLLRSLFCSWFKVVISDPKSEHLQAVVDLAAAGKLTIPVAKVITLPEAPAWLTELERGNRLTGKVVIAF